MIKSVIFILRNLQINYLIKMEVSQINYHKEFKIIDKMKYFKIIKKLII